MKFDGPELKGRWKLGPRLGSGSQAHTHLAIDTEAKGERIVVVKRFHLKGSGTKQTGSKSGGWKKFELFEREIRVLRSLEHEGIPKFLASFEEGPGVFNLVMERAPGATLRSVATRVRFSDADLRDLLERILRILVYLHELNPPVIHRDIKPANLVRSASGSIALVDFGGVRDALRERGGSTVVGTFGYMAPEQLHGDASAATDIYGLGATVVALAGQVEPEDVPRRGLKMDLATHLPNMAPELRDVLVAMTAPDPDNRPQSARAVLELLAKPAKVAETIALPPASDQALAPREQGDIERVADDLGDLAGDAPGPVRVLLRIIFFAIGLGGYIGLTVIRAALLPIIFGLVGGFSSDKNKPAIARARDNVADALDEGRRGFIALQRGGKRRRALPAPTSTQRKGKKKSRHRRKRGP